jgi:hypothetical protein
MALIQMGTIVTKIRGKISGSVFSGNIAGDTLRNKTIPRRTTTVRRSIRNNNWKYFSQLWLTLSNTDRAAWSSYATNFQFYNKLGSPVAARGNLVFNNTNVYYYGWNGSPILTAPTFATPVAVINPSVSIAIAFPQAVFNCDPQASDVLLQLYCSPPFVGGKETQYQRRMVAIGAPMLLSSGVATFSFTPFFFAIYPYIRAGQKVVFGIRKIEPSCYAWSPIEIIPATIFP